MRIALIGDLHYPSMIGQRKDVKEARDKFYTSFIHSFFEIEADYYVSIGDLTNFGMEDELREVYQIIRKYHKNFIHTLGNHDLYGIPREEVLNISDIEQNISMETDLAHLIFLETARDHNDEDYSGYLSDDQLAWLEEQIIQSGEKLVLIFAHHPVYNTTARSNFPYLSIVPEVPIQDILRKKRGNGMYVNGHNHIDSIETIDNWTYIQAGSILDDPSIRILEINQDEISIKAINVGNPELKKQSQMIGSAIHHFQFNPYGIGTTSNREKVIKQVRYS
ncbi:metallophosphoesterase [Lederbergia sp. NSJ-179]|uniref:metallophosphoesterase family protein n=1 Tax=Lederbergia sp. NSJ-179 TaxID=2931402 RepID=UPI001FCFEA17|nr:metallophosphoesterase [Lederbergia sp. NSJ-179]MCJ7840399.1 metallophosphoesterase [Lederbergia sp. NSJ-179]